MDWLTAMAFVLGAAVGALTIYLLRHRFDDTQALRRRLSEIQTELENYRTRVDEHFERTSDLFQEVTEKYRDLHDHLAQGATGLTRGARRLTSVDLPEKSLLPSGTEPDAPHDDASAVVSEHTIDEQPPAREQSAGDAAEGEDAGVEPVTGLSESSGKPHVCTADETEGTARTENRVAGEEAVRR